MALIESVDLVSHIHALVDIGIDLLMRVHGYSARRLVDQIVASRRCIIARYKLLLFLHLLDMMPLCGGAHHWLLLILRFLGLC